MIFCLVSFWYPNLSLLKWMKGWMNGWMNDTFELGICERKKNGAREKQLNKQIKRNICFILISSSKINKRECVRATTREQNILNGSCKIQRTTNHRLNNNKPFILCFIFISFVCVFSCYFCCSHYRFLLVDFFFFSFFFSLRTEWLKELLTRFKMPFMCVRAQLQPCTLALFDQNL